MPDSAIVQIEPLGFPWQTIDPFLFCVHHDDAYPAGNGAYGPAASLAGRRVIGGCVVRCASAIRSASTAT